VEALTNATRIVIIGFSIPPTDIHFKYLLAAGLQENISLRKIYCFNPEPEVEDNLFTILRDDLKDQRRFEFHQLYLEDIYKTRTPDYQSIPGLFNRNLSKKIMDISPANADE